MRPAPPARRSERHALRAAAAVALVGYGLVLGAAPTGHGLRLAAHLLAAHHASVEALLFGAEAHGHDEAPGERSAQAAPLSGRAHIAAKRTRSAARPLCPPASGGTDVRARERRDLPHVRGAASAPGHTEAPPDVHAHDGVAHSHHEAPPPPAVVPPALDKHTLAPRPAVPIPAEARVPAPRVSAEALATRGLDVEVRPPETTA